MAWSWVIGLRMRSVVGGVRWKCKSGWEGWEELGEGWVCRSRVVNLFAVGEYASHCCPRWNICCNGGRYPLLSLLPSPFSLLPSPFSPLPSPLSPSPLSPLPSPLSPSPPLPLPSLSPLSSFLFPLLLPLPFSPGNCSFLLFIYDVVNIWLLWSSHQETNGGQLCLCPLRPPKRLFSSEDWLE